MAFLLLGGVKSLFFKCLYSLNKYFAGILGDGWVGSTYTYYVSFFAKKSLLLIGNRLKNKVLLTISVLFARSGVKGLTLQTMLLTLFQKICFKNNVVGVSA